MSEERRKYITDSDKKDPPIDPEITKAFENLVERVAMAGGNIACMFTIGDTQLEAAYMAKPQEASLDVLAMGTFINMDDNMSKLKMATGIALGQGGDAAQKLTEMFTKRMEDFIASQKKGQQDDDDMSVLDDLL